MGDDAPRTRALLIFNEGLVTGRLHGIRLLDEGEQASAESVNLSYSRTFANAESKWVQTPNPFVPPGTILPTQYDCRLAAQHMGFTVLGPNPMAVQLAEGGGLVGPPRGATFAPLPPRRLPGAPEDLPDLSPPRFRGEEAGAVAGSAARSSHVHIGRPTVVRRGSEEARPEGQADSRTVERRTPIVRGAVPPSARDRRYGFHRDPGGPRDHLHAGVDIGRANDLVFAPANMTVVAVGTASYGNDIPRESEPLGYAGYGPGWIVARDQFGFFHLFAHIVEPGVLVDDNVVTGYPIARVSTRSRHLHWEIRRRQFAVHGTDTFANTIDPFAWLTTQEERNE